MGSTADWASVFVTLVLGIVGFVIARNIGRDVRLKMTERRLVAYERLWALMHPASPTNPPLDRDARECLHGMFTNWYYQHGDGMLLDRVSRSVYLQAKDNLTCPIERLKPVESQRRLRTLAGDDFERERGKLAQRQLSLLRTQLKTDLAVFGRPFGPPLGPEDRAFLRGCGVDLARKPWSESARTDEEEMERGGSGVSGATSVLEAQE